ncbi:MAG: hypothetical protein E6K78_08375 [Candidatus Eisenbacteria bacterium]|uniref:DUF5666 domain-containing protein n=1 Tax=Eiseniibacteriota bacterium TaxID=2212470 RepID=A0A538TN89_UNCEI|nr:MAG: hypothetical protein E6K78_08375 [Candidatus Eisenbacteria bacterium]
MKRLTVLAFSLALMITALPAIAHQGHHVAGEKVVTKTITGEVVDMGCYLGHAARGEKHVSCATKCLNQGMPMGLLTSNGTLYLVTLDHDNADPFNGLKDMAGKNVTVTGELLTRSGTKAIEASKVQLASK